MHTSPPHPLAVPAPTSVPTILDLFPATVITTSADYVISVFGIDMDGDGDTDVLSASRYDDTVAWYENLDGSGGSFSTHVIATSADYAMSVFAIDMDGDGDTDVMSASRDDDTVAWYENLGRKCQIPWDTPACPAACTDG